MGTERVLCPFCGSRRTGRRSLASLQLYVVPIFIAAAAYILLALFSPPSYRRISSLDESDNFAKVRLLGEVTNVRVYTGKYSKDTSVVMTLRDSSPATPGTTEPFRDPDSIRLKAEGEVGTELKQRGLVPEVGHIIDVTASVFAGSGYRVLSLGSPHSLQITGETENRIHHEEVSVEALLGATATFRDKDIHITRAVVSSVPGKGRVKVRDPRGERALMVFGVSTRGCSVGDTVSVRGRFVYYERAGYWELKSRQGDREALVVRERAKPGTRASPGYTSVTLEELALAPRQFAGKRVSLEKVRVTTDVNRRAVEVASTDGKQRLIVFGVDTSRWKAGDLLSVRGTYTYYERGKHWEIKTARGDRGAVVPWRDGPARETTGPLSPPETSPEPEQASPPSPSFFSSLGRPGVVATSVAAALAGLLVAAFISLIPGLHIFNVIAITMLLYFAAMDVLGDMDPMIMSGFMFGMVVAFSMLFTVSSQYFQPADQSFRSIILPHERLLYERRAHEAVILGGVGALAALFVLVLGLPLMTGPLGAFIQALSVHHYWILGTIIAFILMTEWPKDHGTGRTVFQRFQDGWVQLLMGYFTFFAAGVLGILVFRHTLVPLDASFQSLMPVFIGLFAIPSYIMTFVTRVKVPPQHIADSTEVTRRDALHGGISGLLAGTFAAINPGLTPGPALLMSGHLTAQTGERQFIIGGGAARMMYYVGSLALFFLPGVYLRRGGAALNVSLFFVPETPEQFYLTSGIIALTGGITYLLLAPFSRLCSRLVSRVPYQAFSAIGLVALTILVVYVTSWQGLVVMAVATVLGIVPNLWHTRRINLLAVLLVPMFLNMAGLGPSVARFLGLH